MRSNEISSVFHLVFEIIVVAALFGIVALYSLYTRSAEEISISRRAAATDMLEYSAVHELTGDSLSVVSDLVSSTGDSVYGYRTSSGVVVETITTASELYATLHGTYPNMSVIPCLTLPASEVSYDEIMFYFKQNPDMPFVMSGTPNSWSAGDAVPLTYRLVSTLSELPNAGTLVADVCNYWDDFQLAAGNEDARFWVAGVFDDMTGGPALLVCWFTT